MAVHRSEKHIEGQGETKIVYCKGEGVCVMSCGNGFACELPQHPRARGRFSPILTEEHAGHVLTELVRPSCDPGANVYVTRGFASGKRIVTAVWFKVDVTRPQVDMAQVFERLRARVVRHAQDRCGEGRDRGFVASGVYLESGLGVLAGKGRGSVTIGGRAHCVPYYRCGDLDDAGEDLLVELMGGLAGVVECVDERMVRREHRQMLERGHQYPRQRLPGAAFIKCHQVAVRACGGPNDPQGSDLHVDSMDGRGDAEGGWTVYAGGRPSSFDRLAVFSSAAGGNGFDVRVGGYGSEWACAVHFDTANQLHGSIWPRHEATWPGFGHAVGTGLRIVMYTLRRIELLEESVLACTGEEQTAISASTDAVKRRIYEV